MKLPERVYVQQGRESYDGKENVWYTCDITFDEVLEAHVGDRDGEPKPGEYVGVYKLEKVIKVTPNEPTVTDLE